MKLNRSKWIISVATCLFFFGIIPVVAPAAELPKMMTWTAYDVGSSSYMQAGFISESLWEKHKIKVRVIPAGTDLPRVFPIRMKDAQVAFHGGGSYYMQEGLFDYATLEWGPQPIRALFFALHPGLALGLRGDSPVKTAADLKGKRVAYYPTYALTGVCESHLVYAGLTWNDVQRVNVPSLTAAIRMVMEGKIETAQINTTASMAYEMEAMPYGIRYVPLPPENKEGWARIKKLVPIYSHMKATIGAGVSKEKPVDTLTQAYPIVIAYDFLSADTAYIMTKLLHETFPQYSKKHQSLAAYWTPETCFRFIDEYPLPMHDGAIRYYKEIGQWTPEREKKNQESLKHQAALKSLWEKVKGEATASKIKSNDFPEFWTKKRKEAGF